MNRYDRSWWEGFGAGRRLRALAILLALALPGWERNALAQTSQPAADREQDASSEATETGSPAGRQELRRRLEREYEVLPIREGLVLRPHEPTRGVRTIELSEEAIAVNGEPVNERVLRDWLGEDAGPVLRLWRLEPAERRTLFDLETAEGGEGEEEAAVPEEVAGEEPAAEDPSGTPEELPEAPEVPEVPDVPEAPEPPSESSGSQVKFGGSITVNKGESVQEAVAIVGSVRVDGEVERDVVAVGGRVTINGRVGGTVTAVGGGVRLGPNAEVMGDVVSVGGSIQREEGARIHGHVQEVGPGDRGWDRDVGFFPWGFWGGTTDVFWELIGLLVLGLLVCLCLLVARRSVDRTDHYVATEPLQAGLIGLAAQVLFFPLLLIVTVLLAISIVGCVLFLLYPFFFLGLLLAALVGYAAVAYRLGRFLEARFGKSFGSPYGVALMGVVAIEIWGLLARVIGLGGGPLDFLAFMLLAFAVAVQYVAWTVGFGAILLAWFRGPNRWRRTAVPPAPVPPPPGPPVYAGPGTPLASDSLPLSERWEDPEPDRRWEEPPPPER